MNNKMSSELLNSIREAFTQLDNELRAISTCPNCGKPTSGLIPAGMTAEKAGLCVCSNDDYQGERE